nr:hypothetical protein [Deltaproteobacteria bacterium]
MNSREGGGGDLSRDDEERTILLRYLRLSAGDEFQLAAVEVPTPAVREALLSWLRARAPDRPLIEVSLKGLPGSVLVEEITAALPPPSERHRGRSSR